MTIWKSYLTKAVINYPSCWCCCGVVTASAFLRRRIMVTLTGVAQFAPRSHRHAVERDSYTNTRRKEMLVD